MIVLLCAVAAKGCRTSVDMGALCQQEGVDSDRAAESVALFYFYHHLSRSIKAQQALAAQGSVPISRM